MPINITIVESKFYNQYKNSTDYFSNLLDFTDNLAASVMENIKVVQTIDVNWTHKASQGNKIIVSGGGTVFRRENGSYFDDSFRKGDLVQVSSSGQFLIDDLTDDVMTFAVNTGQPDDAYEVLTLTGVTALKALVYNFGLIDNNESFNISSKVSGNDQGYYAAGIGEGATRSTAFVDMQRLGSPRDWQTGNIARVRFVEDTAKFAQRFEIEHEFMVVPYYLDGQINNLKDNVIPDLLNGENSLKYVYEPKFRTVISNPNAEKAVQKEDNLGSVAWFNENFNGFQNNYKINSVSYQDANTGVSADGILITSKTTVTIEIEKTNGNFGSDKYGVYVSYLPEQEEYTNTVITDLKENFIYDNAIVDTLFPVGVNGQTFITQFNATNSSTNINTLTFDVEYSMAQKMRLSEKNAESPANYLIGVQVGERISSSGNSDRVMLLAEVNNYDESADIEGLLDFPKFDILTHEKPLSSSNGTSDVIAWDEDGVLVDYRFKLNLNKDAVLNSLSFLLVAYDPGTKKYFELDKYDYNIFPAIVSGGVQQLILDDTRGYILKQGDQFNDVKLNVGSNFSNFQSYEGVIGQKFSWQDWIENLDVDTIFFDSTKPNNNFNLKSSNYSFLNGYEIKLAFLGNVFGTSDMGVSGFTDYLALSPALTIYDYGKDGNVTPIWSETIETFDATGTNNLSLAILSGQDTLFRSTWTNSGGAVTSLDEIWGINRIEETNQLGFAITEMSSLNLPSSNQLLKPKNGLTLLDVQLVGGNVVFECLIDGSLAQSGVSYNLSTRIQADNAIIIGKRTEQKALKETEQGVLKIIE